MQKEYEWTDYAVELKQKGYTWKQIAKEIHEQFGFGRSAFDINDLVRGQVRRRLDKEIKIEDIPQTFSMDLELGSDGEILSQSYGSDGTIEQVKKCCIAHGEKLTPDRILELHGLNPDEWEVVIYTNNNWQTVNKKDGTALDLFQSKVKARPAVSKVPFKALDEFFATRDFSKPPLLTNPMQYDHNGEILEVCLPDLHSGLFSWRYETGEDYDIHIALQRLYAAFDDILSRCYGKKFKKIVLASLGDLLHVDNNKQETNKGTFLQADGRFAKIFEATLDALIKKIEELCYIAPVEVVYVPGNHDLNTGYALMVACSKAFRNDPNVEFDIMPNPQKWRRWGNVLVGWTHGDMPRKNMSLWLQQRAREDFGKSKYAEIHAGHYHSQQGIEFKTTDENAGVIVRYLPTVCSSSNWEHQQGYGNSVKTVVSYVWNEDCGLRETWYSNV